MAKTLKPLMVAPPMVHGSLPNASGSGRGGRLEHDGGRGGECQQHAERRDEHDQRRSRALQHVDVEPSIECEPDRAREQARDGPAQVEPGAGRVGKEERDVAPGRRPDDGRGGDHGHGRHRTEGPSVATPDRPDHGEGYRHAEHGAEEHLEPGREREQDRRVYADSSRQHAARDGHGAGAVAAAQASVVPRMERPPQHARGDDAERDVEGWMVDLILPAQRLLRAQVEHSVGADGRRRAVVQVKEPHGAVDEGEAHRQQRVDGAHGRAVEGELQRLLGRLGDLPAEVGNRRRT